MRKQKVAIIFVAVIMIGAPLLSAQQQPAQAPQAPAPVLPRPPALIPLKVEVVLSKYQGEKRVSSLPYTLSVIADDRGTNQKSEVANVIQVHIPFVSVEGKMVGPVYKDVGTKIACYAGILPGDRFKLILEVQDDAVYSEQQAPANGPKPPPGTPWIRSFRSDQAVILRDGQATQYTAGTDKITGEVVKVDVTLAVVK